MEKKYSGEDAEIIRSEIVKLKSDKTHSLCTGSSKIEVYSITKPELAAIAKYSGYCDWEDLREISLIGQEEYIGKLEKEAREHEAKFKEELRNPKEIETTNNRGFISATWGGGL